MQQDPTLGSTGGLQDMLVNFGNYFIISAQQNPG